MRFLIVPQDLSKDVRALLERLSVHDVVLVLVKKKEDAPGVDDLAMFKLHPQAPAALVSVKRDYAKVVKTLLNVQLQPKKFRADDQLLHGWLLPVPPVVEAPPDPRTAMSSADSACHRLLFAKNALKDVDLVPKHRHGFVARAAVMLVRFANGEELGPPNEWKERHCINFASGGDVSYKFHFTSNGRARTLHSYWHLKEGDFTTAESAVRIYLAKAERDGIWVVFVAYVGPHPKHGERDVYF